jgi:hypothetical protein
VHGGGTTERINAVPVVVGTGAQPGPVGYFGLTSDGLLLDQHGWQVEVGAPGHRDATGSSRQMALIYADVPFHEREGVAGGWKLRISCGFLATFNPSIREAKRETRLFITAAIPGIPQNPQESGFQKRRNYVPFL